MLNRRLFTLRRKIEVQFIRQNGFVGTDLQKGGTDLKRFNLFAAHGGRGQACHNQIFNCYTYVLFLGFMSS